MKTSKMICVLAIVAVVLGLTAAGAFAQQGRETTVGDVVGYTPPDNVKGGVQNGIDYKNAKPMPLPQATSAPQPLTGAPANKPLGAPGFKAGSPGDGKTIPDTTAIGDREQPQASDSNDIIIPQEYGTSDHPFTTSRVELSTTAANAVSKLYPYRAAGKLYFNIGVDTYVCSASLIQPGIIVTAAHCVIQFGSGTGWYANWKFIPAMHNTTKPYGTWSVVKAWALGSYANGTDACSQAGVVCTNDVALLVAKPAGKVYPGKKTGWFGYGWDGYGFTTPASGPYSGSTVALINQLGYPVTHDSGLKMQRTDSQGFVSTMVNNTVWGSRQTGGSSGGPELVNLGTAATLSGTDYGSDAQYNTVVGVTSWGYNDTTVKQQGASAFTSSNIVPLVNAACADIPAACTP